MCFTGQTAAKLFFPFSLFLVVRVRSEFFSVPKDWLTFLLIEES
jgi:hypothetical protein